MSLGGKSGNLPSVMKHDFSQVPKAEIPRSSFDRSHGYKTTFNAGYLIPVFMDEALPGDTFNLKMSSFARLATPIVPFMDNLYCDSFFFAVPIRLIWDNFKKFMGEQNNPGDSVSYLVPTCDTPDNANGALVGTLSDYMGIPTGVQDLTYNNLHHRAYALIWNEWFRDQNLQNKTHLDTGDGPDLESDYVLLKRGKRHDYFTSALPWPQKGTAVTIPLGTTAPITRTTNAPYWTAYQDASNTNEGAGAALLVAAGAGTALWDTVTKLSFDPRGGLTADLTNASAATINSLRQAFQIQKLYERDARGGTRYIEMVRSHFGVTSPDSRMQRPEYLGGGSTPIKISPIPQTSPTSGSNALGQLAATGTLNGSGHGFTKSFTEHCILLGLVSVRADLNYQQGLNRMFSRQTRLDFYWPALSHIGEQSILNKELYCKGDGNDALTFGYQERYAEYRYKPSVITGQFRSTYSTPLDVWHLAQKFTSLPTLGDTFIQDSPPIDRVIAVAGTHFLFDAYFDLKCARPMPTYSVPGLIDHF